MYFVLFSQKYTVSFGNIHTFLGNLCKVDYRAVM